MAASTAVTVEDTAPRSSPAERTAQIAALTGLRGFAALMVVVVHSSFLTSYAWVGIPNYGPMSLFLLSGYLLYRPWSRWTLQAGDRPSVTTFFRRRLARIFPAYLTVFFCVTLVYPPSRPTSPQGWFQMITLTWIYGDDPWPAEFAQTWSLATELSWYVALPVMAGVTAMVARRRSPRTGFWVAVGMISIALPVSVLWRAWVSTLHQTVTTEADAAGSVPYFMWLPSFLACFAAGALVAHLSEGHRLGLVRLTRLRRLAADPWAPLLFVLAVALLGTSTLGGPAGWPETFAEEQVRQVGAGLIALTLLTVAVLGGRDTPLNRLLSTGWANAIGRWSYGIFLWHMPVLLILEQKVDYEPGFAGFAARLVLVLGTCIPLAAATYAWIELPVMEWSHRPFHIGGWRQRADRARRSAPTADATPEPASRSTTSTQPADAPSTTSTTSAPAE